MPNLMNKKKLAIELSKLKKLDKLNVNLEQYQTEGDFASELLLLASINSDINGKVVADFGCGNGILGIGALLLGAKFVYFLDSDKNALDICKENLSNFSDNKYKLSLGDISNFNNKINTVIMNPPFGVQKRKADKVFLETAMQYAARIYSIHKIEAKNFINALCKDNGFKILDVLEREFTIKKSYKFHTKSKYGFRVGIWVLGR